MANDPAFVAHLLEMMDGIEGITSKRMFGGHGIFRDGLMFGLVADSTLYLKVDAENRGDFEALGLGPFLFGDAENPKAMSYHRTPDETLEDPDEMRHWIESAYAAALRSKKR